MKRKFFNTHRLSTTTKGLKYSFILVLIFYFSSSCKKKNSASPVEEPTPVNTGTPTPIIVPRTSWEIDTLDKDLTITKHTNTLTNVNEIDVNGDKIIDIKIGVSSWHSANSSHDYSTFIETVNNDTYILTNSVYDIFKFNNCTNTSATVSVNGLAVKALKYKEAINPNDTWKQAKITISQDVIDWPLPPNAPCSSGYFLINWPSKEYRYIAVKIKGKIGWLKILSDGYLGMYLKEYALFKP